MALPLPTSLSPSKVATFKDCALAFRFSAIDKLPEPPSVPSLEIEWRAGQNRTTNSYLIEIPRESHLYQARSSASDVGKS